MSGGGHAEQGQGSPRRLVSLVPSLTETLFELGAGADVVGATKFCVHPREGMEHVTRIGGTKDPKIERILALKPTLVFANEEENRLEDVERLRAAGVPVHVTFPRTVAQVGPMILGLGSALGCPREAQVLADRVVAAQGQAAAAAPSRGSRFLVLVWRGPWMAASADTFLSDLLETAGGVNVVAGGGASRYPEVSLEQITAWDPDVVVLPSEPYPFQPPHADELVRGARIRGARFVFCDGELLTWHGARTADGLLAAREWLTTTDR